MGYPAYIIYPLVVANILGLVAIWYRKFQTLQDWAYSGFLFNFLLAFGAALKADDTDLISPILALTALITS
jgi:hypothetical protein